MLCVMKVGMTMIRLALIMKSVVMRTHYETICYR